MNVAAYIIYLFITYIITVRVGKSFYINGRHYILTIVYGDEKLTDFINKILLSGYYLVNLGYATIMLSFWKTVNSLADVIASVCNMTGKIILSLAIIHFANMLIIKVIGKKATSFHKL